MQLLQTTMRLRIPEDISIVSGEHLGWSGLFNPPLTTIDAPLELANVSGNVPITGTADDASTASTSGPRSK